MRTRESEGPADDVGRHLVGLLAQGRQRFSEFVDGQQDLQGPGE